MSPAKYDEAGAESLDEEASEVNAVEASGSSKRQVIKIKEGISQESAKKIIAEIKKSKIKVQLKIQGDELRADGKKRDDLQEVMQAIQDIDIGQPVEFTNLRD